MDKDTIVAVSSPPGISARGILRLSGPDALRIASMVFQSDALKKPPDCAVTQRISGRLSVLESSSLPASAYYFFSPHSYTGQDVVELHMPGSPGLLSLVTDALLAAGARAAEPGEFTLRAVRGGKLDLSQAEGVAEMISARFDGQLRAARRLMDGALSRTALAAADELLDLRSLVEASLDFADEDIDFIKANDLLTRLEAVSAHLRDAIGAGHRVERLLEPPRIVLAGPPNAGKSTLLNRLSGLDRAICSPMAGTTRDVLSAPIQLAHSEVLLCDTPGLMKPAAVDSPRTGVNDAVVVNERAYEAAVRAARDAALVVWLTPIDEQVDPPADVDVRRMLRVVNKCDLLNITPPGNDLIYISAITGQGCDRLLAVLDERLSLRDESGDDVILSADLRRALSDAIECITRAIMLARSPGGVAGQAELVAAELQEAAERLGQLTGQSDVDELYDRVFSRFCVGK